MLILVLLAKFLMTDIEGQYVALSWELINLFLCRIAAMYDLSETTKEERTLIATAYPVTKRIDKATKSQYDCTKIIAIERKRPCFFRKMVSAEFRTEFIDMILTEYQDAKLFLSKEMRLADGIRHHVLIFKVNKQKGIILAPVVPS